ncbi:ABC-three component system middle component 1 [Vibrio lentus]
MNNLINRILISNGYQETEVFLHQDSAELNLFKPNLGNHRQEYFLVVKLNDQSDESARKFLDIHTQDWFDKINTSGLVEQEFAKNCTLILCHKEDKIDRNTLLMIEEDQYNFKKNIITYSDSELLDLQSYIDKNQLSEISEGVINSIINQNGGMSFLHFKSNNKEQKDYYSLILKIILKLPFISYLPQEQELSNLLGDIEHSFSSNQLSIYKKLTESSDLWAEDEIEEKIEDIWGTDS